MRDITARDVLASLVREHRLLLRVPFAFALVSAVVSVLLPKEWTATSVIAPETASTTRLPASLVGLAGQVGLSLGGDATQSPHFYASILRDRTVIDRAVEREFDEGILDDGVSGVRTLSQLFGAEYEDSVEARWAVIREMEERVRVSVDELAGTVAVSVRMRSPVASAAVANAFVEVLGEVNSEVRQSRARERRGFAETRLGEVADSLKAHEEMLRRFLEANRQWQASPALTFERDRLLRELGVWQSLEATLRQEVESAKLAEVNDVPVFSVLYDAIAPFEKSHPRRTLIVLFFFALGLGGAAFGVLIRDFVLKDVAEEGDDLTRWNNAWQELLRSGESLLARIRRS